MNYDAVIIAGKEKKIMAASILEGVPWTKIVEARLFVESAVQILYNSRPCVFVAFELYSVNQGCFILYKRYQ